MNADEMKQYVTPDKDPRKNADHLFMYKGINCRQTPRVLDALDQLRVATAADPPKMIIEIGTFHGAFTRVLKDHDISEGAQIHTFDITNFQKPVVEETTYHYGDVFGGELEVIRRLSAEPGRCLIFCDGGNKEREVKVLCSLLKVGDIILCHDYVRTPDVMKDKGIVGNWPEVQYESQWANVERPLTANGFVPFEELTMQRAMWGAFMKMK